MFESWINSRYRNGPEFKQRFASASPFSHIVLRNFFIPSRARLLRRELLREDFVDRNSDLFQFSQTGELSASRSRHLLGFNKLFNCSDFLRFVGEISGRRLRSADMSGFVYKDTDYLLPHDDRLEGRLVAYVVNLSYGFGKGDGGALQLFDGKRVVKEYVPEFNSLVLFSVSEKSVHAVSEVSSRKKRVSITGWFHG